MPPWFRFYSETLTDRKVERISRSLEQPKALVIGAWAILMAIGSDSPVRGVLLLTEDIAFTESDLADEMGLDLDNTRAILDRFERFKMLHRDDGVIYLTNWDKRQFASDDSSERVKRYRERKKASQEQEGNGDVTLQDSDGNAPETETETEQRQNRSDKRGGKNQPPPRTDRQAMFSALATAYRISLETITKAQRGRLNAESKRLLKADRTPDEVLAAGEHWWTMDWRGKDKRSPPTSSQLFQTVEVIREANAENQFQEAEPWQ